MNKLFLIITLVLLATPLLASNYPPDYCNQTAHFAVKGPVVFGQVTSGCMSNNYVIGYKNSGIFGDRDFIEAIITVNSKTHDGGSTSTTIVVQMTREWNGTGLMSSPISLPTPIYLSEISNIEIAFSSEGEWDSQYGSNYQFSPRSFNLIKRSDANSSGGDIVLPLWDFIISLMY